MIRVSYGAANGSGDGANNATTYKWPDAAQPYLKSTQIFNCPSDSGKGNNIPYDYSASGVGPTTGTAGQYKYGSYAMNCTGGGRTGPATNGTPDISQASIQEPATTLWVADWEPHEVSDKAYRLVGNPRASTTGDGGFRLPFILNNSGAIGGRHLDTANVLYCDGHVKAMKLDNIVKIGSAGTYSMLTPESD